jgi:hypothetical protein
VTIRTKMALGGWLLFQTLFAQPAEDSAAEAARAFYTLDAKLKLSGLPDTARLKEIAPHLSSGLQALMVKAQSQQAHCIKSHPGDKGPWVEGDMFTSNFEGFTRFAFGPAKSEPTRVIQTVDFEYSENGPPVRWQDQVILIKEKGRWVIDEISYGHAQGLGNGFGAGLRASLTTKGC